MRRSVLVIAVSCMVATISAVLVHAQTYPTHSIRLIVPFAAGGLNDVVSRLVSPYLEKALGQPVVVDNRPAAAGIVGTDATAKAPPDGHTLLMVASSHTVVPATRPRLPYDAERDLSPIIKVAQNSLLFVINSNLPAHSLAEFVALVKANPGKFNYSTPGPASQAHLLIELFSQKAGIKMQHIPYRGGNLATQAVLTGETHFTVISTVASMPFIRGGTLRGLATGNLKRDAQLPDLPTVAEQGYPDFEAVQWIGLLTTAGTPNEVVERLNTEMDRALREPDLIAKFAQQGLQPGGGSSADFARVISSDIKKWTEIARAANIRVE